MTTATDRSVEDWPFVRRDEWTPEMQEHVRRLVHGGTRDTHADCPCVLSQLDAMAFLW